LGTHDQITPIELAEEYFSLLDAPHKEFVRFDGDGYFFCKRYAVTVPNR
jgi:pimeloyl-ACP methyl ester carboxylesterase